MKVAELIAFLQTQDPDAEVVCDNDCYHAGAVARTARALHREDDRFWVEDPSSWKREDYEAYAREFLDGDPGKRCDVVVISAASR